MVEMPRQEVFHDAQENREPQVAVTPPVKRRLTAKRAALFAALLAGVAGAGVFAQDYWVNGRFMASTDDAYVKSDFTTVAPKVSGYLAEVLVQDNQHVAAGQTLARIDDRDFRAALAQAHAEKAAAVAQAKNIDAQIDLQQAAIDAARAQIDAVKARLAFANADAERYSQLNRSGYGTLQRAQQTESLRGQEVAQLAHDEAELIAAQRKLTVLAAQRTEAQAKAEKAEAAEAQAELNLSYTKVVAAVDGEIGARSLRVGQYVTAGTQLMAVVPLAAAYVVANFKETQLTDVRPGQPADIEVDTFPGRKIKGHVDSLAPASGLEFSLLPPDNATGNFTKIVQRIPVKIVLDNSALRGVLRAGMSVEATIDTKAQGANR